MNDDREGKIGYIKGVPQERIRQTITVANAIIGYGTIKDIDILFNYASDNKTIELARIDIMCSLRELGIVSRSNCDFQIDGPHLNITNETISLKKESDTMPLIIFNGLITTKAILDGFDSKYMAALMINVPKVHNIIYNKKFSGLISSLQSNREMYDAVESKYYNLFSILKSYAFKAVSVTVAIDGHKRLKELERRKVNSD